MKARIQSIDPERMNQELKQGNVIIVAGFQGMTPEREITTLGRGGSDTTAVAIAAAIGADLCEIYTDVDGVYTADPRIVQNTSKLKQITYDEMLELASLGAKVLHPRSVELAKIHQVKLCVRSSFDTSKEGTFVVDNEQIEKNMLSLVLPAMPMLPRSVFLISPTSRALPTPSLRRWQEAKSMWI